MFSSDLETMRVLIYGVFVVTDNTSDWLVTRTLNEMLLIDLQIEGVYSGEKKIKIS